MVMMFMTQLKMALAFLGRDAALARTYPIALVLNFAGTLLTVGLLYLPARAIGNPQVFADHGGFLPFAIVGMSLMGFFMACYSGFASAISREHAMGTLEALLMSPVRVPTLVLGTNAWNLLLATLTLLLTIGAGALLYDIEIRGNWLEALLVAVLTAASFASFGILSAAFIMVFKRGDPFRLLVSVGFFLLGGVVYPIDLFPAWLRWLAAWLPITHGAHALRAILLHGTPIHALTEQVAMLGVFAALGLPASLSCFAVAIRRAKRDGTLLQY